ncbi:MAG: DNA-binding protein [Lachnospiraceae bacterium]|nr:DNA-binding protein [Lachnospiraceae bacterium]
MSTGREGKIRGKKADAEEWLHEAVDLSVYYAYYGALLSERARSIFEDYIANDMSLAEISRDYGLSRQGVYDVVKRCGAKLYEYEDKLRLAERFRGLEEQAEKIRDGIAGLSERCGEPQSAEALDKLAKLAEDLLASLQ